MSFLEITLGISLLAVFSIATVWVMMIAAARRASKEEAKQLKLDVESRDRTISELREEIVGHHQSSSDLKAQLAVCSDRSERLKQDLDGAAQQITELRRNLGRYATIDDAETHAANVRKAAENSVSELTQKAATIKLEALAFRDQALKLKAQGDSLSVQVRSLEIFREGCNSIEKVNTRIEQQKALHDTVVQALEASQAERAKEFEEQLVNLSVEIDRRKAELGLVDEVAEMQSFGIYNPRFNFDHSDNYRTALDACVARQKQMVCEKAACLCSTTWSVQGSEAKGRTMINRNIKLMLRAVNGECDAIIAKVNYNNVESSEKRIKKCFEVIDKLGNTNQISFSIQYQQLKLQELYLNYEYAAMKQEEKERERSHREAMREEEKAEKEITKAKEAAEKEESTKELALNKAREELAEQHGKHNAKLEELVQKLEGELSEAIDRKAKAIARAQLTKSGHVYILSNIGTMGEGVFKIGMTRRLEPLDRVKELGDASVPFPFDVHAMIYSEDAPALENALHKSFNDRRVNLVNLRREYFHVTLDEIREAVADLYGLVTFRLTPEAEQYRTTLGLQDEARLASAS